MLFQVTSVATTSLEEFFTMTKMVPSAGQLMDPNVEVVDILTTLHTTPRLFQMLKNFTLVKFKKLVVLVVPTIINHVRLTIEVDVGTTPFEFHTILPA
jgi:hypothetical protein